MIAHIGFPKTGTTFLQQSVFKHCHKVRYIGYQEAEKMLYPIIFFDDLDFYAENEKNKLDKKYLNENILISYELLTGPVFLRSGINRSIISKRLKKIGTKKIIITIRNQIELIESLYRQYINQGGTLNLSDILLFEGDHPNYSHGILIKMFDYYKLIKLYCHYFGRENILIINQKDLKENPNQAVKKIADFINDVELYNSFINDPISRKKNKALSYYSILILRFFNRFTSNYFSPKSIFGNFFTTWKIRKVLGEYLDPLILNRLSEGKNFVKNTSLHNKIQRYF